MMMKAAPSASFIVTEPEFLLQFLIVALDPPAQLGQVNEIPQRHIRRQSGQPVFGGFRFALRPLDQTPFLRPGAGAIVVTMRRPHPHRSKTRRQLGVAAFTPGDPMPLLFRQTQRQFLGGYRLPCRIAADQLWRAAIAAPALRRLGCGARHPDAGLGLDAGDIAQAKIGDAIAEAGIDAVACVHQHGSR